MILLDECISHHLKEFLEDNGLEERIICVSQHEGLKGKSDDFLMGYALGAEVIFNKPTTLITADHSFFNDFYGSKVMYSHNNWHGMAKYLKKILGYSLGKMKV